MRYNILISGKAGQGIKGLANILSKSLVKTGLYVFNYRMYQSLIRGGHNFNILCISDKPVHSFDKEYNIVVLFDKESLKIHKNEFKKQCIQLDNKKIDNSEFKKAKNMVFAGAIFKIFNLNTTPLENTLKNKVSGTLLKEDLEAVKKGYNTKLKTLKIKPTKKENYYLDGSEAVGIGAIESGLDIYYAYPMTPATPLLAFLAKNQKNYNYLTFEPENEIAVANAGLGASYGGARTMIGSSGGGIDLMTEALSMQGMTELPLVTYLAMRGGPSSGAATYSSQQDLKMALNTGHGDFPRIVIAPGDSEEAYKTTKQAFYLAEKYGLLNILLSDKHLAESGFTQDIKPYNLFIKKSHKYPSTDFVKTNSYTHDKQGNYTEDAETIKLMADKRKKKFKKAKKEIEDKFETYKVYGKKTSKKTIIGFGSTKGAILDTLNTNNLNIKYLHILYLSPFSEKLKSEINKAKEIFVIENNITGQLADLIQLHTEKTILEKKRILKYNERPFTPKEIKERLK